MLFAATGRGSAAFNLAVHRCAWGRPTPDELRLVTQTLIEWDYGLGVDCSGYVQQAFLDVHGGSRGTYGYQGIGDEALYDLKGNKAFEREMTPVHARPGPYGGHPVEGVYHPKR